MLRLLLTLCAVAILNGCSAYQYARHRDPIPFKAFPDQGAAAIYLWPPYTSAAIVDRQGTDACSQPAARRQ